MEAGTSPLMVHNELKYLETAYGMANIKLNELCYLVLKVHVCVKESCQFLKLISFNSFK